MSQSNTLVAVTDLYAAPGVLVAVAGETVSASNEHAERWKAEGAVAAPTTKAAKEATSAAGTPTA